MTFSLGSATDPSINFSGDLNTGIYSPGADQVSITTGGTQRVAVDASGNVTINGQGDIRLADSDSSNWVAFQSPATVASNVTWTLPGADGTSGQFLSTSGTGTLSWNTPQSANFQEFTTSGTWTKPASANFVMVEVWGAGGGGGSGTRQAVGTNAYGGSAGSGGSYYSRLFKASDLSSTVAVTVGAGGTGGTAITVDSTVGNPGTSGGNTTFGSYLTVYGGNNGVGGNTTGATGVGGAGVFGRGAGPVGGPPDFRETSGNITIGSAAGGGKNAGFGGTSVFGGGGSGSSYNEGGSSVYAGAGGAGGVNLLGSTSLPFPPYVGATGLFGSSGSSGKAFGTAPSSATWSRIAFGNNTYVLTSAATYAVATSTNGTTWSSTPYTITNASNLIYGNGVWVYFSPGASSSTIYSSSDLENWTVAGIINFQVRSLAYNSGTYVAVGNLGNIVTSTDLSLWTTRTSGTTLNLLKVLYDGAKWLVAGSPDETTNVFLTSTDTITWTAASGGTSLWYIHDIATNGASNYVVVGYLNPNVSYSTNGGTTWTNTSTALPGAGTNAYSSGRVAYGNGLFVLVNGTNILSSPTGQTWTARTNPTGDSLSGVVFANGLFFVSSNSNNVNAGLSSTDGITWTNQIFTGGTTAPATAGGTGAIACGGGGGGASRNGNNSGAGGSGGPGYCRVYTW
jgi:hypothetical protein